MQIEPQTIIETTPEIPGGFVKWIIGIFIGAVLGLFGFVKWLVGITVKDVSKLRSEVSLLRGEIASNVTGDAGIVKQIDDLKTDIHGRIKDVKTDLQKDISRIENRISNHVESRLKEMEREIKELKSK